MKAIRVKNRLLGMLVSAALCFGAGAALAADFSIKVAYENNPGEPVDQAVREWARLFAQKTGGRG